MNILSYPVKSCQDMQPFNHNKSFMQATPSTSLNYTGQTRAKTEAQNLTGVLTRDDLSTVNFS